VWVARAEFTALTTMDASGGRGVAVRRAAVSASFWYVFRKTLKKLIACSV
jgi:hypothetical protein